MKEPKLSRIQSFRGLLRTLKKLRWKRMSHSMSLFFSHSLFFSPFAYTVLSSFQSTFCIFSRTFSLGSPFAQTALSGFQSTFITFFFTWKWDALGGSFMQSIVWQRQNWWTYWSHAHPCYLESRLLQKRPSLPHMGPRELGKKLSSVKHEPFSKQSMKEPRLSRIQSFRGLLQDLKKLRWRRMSHSMSSMPSSRT